MRRIVEPPPTTQCDRCGSQLRLKRVETASSGLEMSSQIFACLRCGNERRCTTPQDHYAARPAAAHRLIYA